MGKERSYYCESFFFFFGAVWSLFEVSAEYVKFWKIFSIQLASFPLTTEWVFH